MPHVLTDTEIKRLNSITACMEILEWIREQPNYYSNHINENYRVIAQIGELDWLEELHRLLYTWPDN